MLTVFITYHYFLGLRTLTVIQDAVEMAEKNTGTAIDMMSIDYNDKAVLDYIGTGKTDGVFQLESAGMKSFMKELSPHNLEDIIAGIALYRPGPMDFIPKYIEGKNHYERVTYRCPQLEPILKATHGCIVYQEQVMQIVRDLAGYSLGRSDLVRRAMSKKKGDVMARERKNFVEGNPEEHIAGCIANGIDRETAEAIFDDMTDFAKYAFNKSHAAAYAVVSYQTAYLKYYYPVEFMAALMTSVMDHPAKVAAYIYECKQMGISVLPPDVNEGEGHFSVSGRNIRYGMNAIKGIGKPVTDTIAQTRRENGPFTSFQDFVERMVNAGVNKRALENMIKAGALDTLWPNRRQMVISHEQLADQAQAEKKKSFSGQISLFDIANEEEKAVFQAKMPDVEDFDRQSRLEFEKEVLGVYISGHPLDEYRDILSRKTSAKTSDFLWDEELQGTTVADDSKQVIGGMITGLQVKITRQEKRMAFLTLEDMFGTVEVIVFPRQYEKYRDLLQEDEKLLIQGKVQVDEEKGGKLILENVRSLTRTSKELWLQFRNFEDYRKQQEQIHQILLSHEGASPVKIYLSETRQMKTLPLKYNVTADEALLDRLQTVMGENNIRVTEKCLTDFAGGRLMRSIT